MKIVNLEQIEEKRKINEEKIKNKIKDYVDDLKNLCNTVLPNCYIKVKYECDFVDSDDITLEIFSKQKEKGIFNKRKIIKSHTKIILYCWVSDNEYLLKGRNWSIRGYELVNKTIEVYDKDFIDIMKGFGNKHNFFDLEICGYRICPHCGKDIPAGSRNTLDGESRGICMYCGKYSVTIKGKSVKK